MFECVFVSGGAYSPDSPSKEIANRPAERYEFEVSPPRWRAAGPTLDWCASLALPPLTTQVRQFAALCVFVFD